MPMTKVPACGKRKVRLRKVCQVELFIWGFQGRNGKNGGFPYLCPTEQEATHQDSNR